MLSLNRFRRLALVLVGSTVLTAVPAYAAQPSVVPAARAVQPAPRMPSVPGIAGSSVRPKTAKSVPARGNVATGVFDVFSGLGERVSHTTLHLPAASGTALMGDWNGDGVRTPGRYTSGNWFVTDAAVGNPTSWVQFQYFRADTDAATPLTARIDGDRVSDVGFFSNGKWQWKMSADGSVKQDDFGQAGDIPVVGDWNGDGKDELGVVRDGSWILRVTGVTKPPKVTKGGVVTMVPEAHAAVVTFPFGTAADIPVVGDWNGDGVDTPGVIRGNTEWIVTDSIAKLGKTKSITIPSIAGTAPLVASQATAYDHCPTASPVAEADGLALQREVRAPAKLKGSTKQPGLAEIQATVQDGLRYAITNDYTKRLKDEWGVPYYDVLNTHKSIEESVRRSANTAQAAAIMLSTTSWKNVRNISRAQLLAYTRRQIRSIACQHGSVSPGGWGDQWQSALWASVAGHAAWMIWHDLTPQERAYVAKMVTAEADAVAARGPHYYRTRDGTELAPGNSKADEVSWDLTAPSLALAMMPNDKRANEWRRAIVEYSIAEFARPSDLSNNVVVNGVNISRALPGTNAQEDGTIINHGIINPDYIQNVVHPWWSASLLRVGRVAAPEAMFLNDDIVYRALSVVDFPSPPYAAPGGTVYKPGGVIYYPQGVKWGARRPATFTGVDSFAAQYSAKDTHAQENLAAHARDTRAMQQRYTDGHIYAKGAVEESYALGKEEYALQQTALAWWATALPTGPAIKVDKSAVKNVNLNPRGPVR